jgi:predicted DNA-binding helix-hairpin-helix protein
MSDLERLELLTRQMHLEPAEECQVNPLPSGGREAITVKTARMPNGQTIRLLKTLLSSYCENNCNYCPFRAQRDFKRAAFTPDDFARLFISLHERGFVEGIFLSSSIIHGAIRSQDLLLDTASILRHHYQYRGYLHLKIMPGAQQAQVEQAMLLADRLSVNLEAPHAGALSILAPRKDLQKDLINPLLWIEKIRREKPSYLGWNGKWPSSTTQYVVGAAGETDLDLLRATRKLFQDAGITRAYFSSFNPIENTPLENLSPSPPLREFRLYQAFFLMRDYGFTENELVSGDNCNLPLDRDPKLSWASQNLVHSPVEINTATRSQLLRVPGIGPASADLIIALRCKNPLKSIGSLQKRRIISAKSSPFILVNGKSPARQLSFY